MPRVLQAVEHKRTALDLVARGLGIAFMQRSAATERPDGIRYVEFPDCVPHVDSAIAWRADARHESIALFVETAEREVPHACALNGSSIGVPAILPVIPAIVEIAIPAITSKTCERA